MSEAHGDDGPIPPKFEDIGLSRMTPHDKGANGGDTTPTKRETQSPSMSRKEYANGGDTTRTKAESPRSDANGDGLNVSAAECERNCETPPTDKEPPKPNR